jgi:hypothetical protein
VINIIKDRAKSVLGNMDFIEKLIRRLSEHSLFRALSVDKPAP